jgi:GPH family glycoside/pentoside/hexuronide:cation symporter
MYTLLWAFPANASLTFVFWYFLLGSIVFYAAYTVWVAPWVALGYELTPDYHERTRVMGYATFFGQAAFLLTPWFLWFMQLKAFGNIMRGATWLAFLISLLVLVCCLLCAIFLRERFEQVMEKRDENAAALANRGSQGLGPVIRDFFKGFWISLKFRPFLKLSATAFLVFNGFMLVASFTIYVWIYYVCGGNKEFGGRIAGVAGTVSGIAGFIVVIIVTKLGTSFGKRRAFIACTIVAVFGYLSKFFLFTPVHPWLSVIPGVLIAFGFGSMFPLVGSMIADVCDLDELQTHERREGMYGAIFWWVIKVGMAAALYMGGVLLNSTGFNVALPTQSANTILLMRILDAGVPAMTSLLAIWLISTFEITEEKSYEVRAELERRKKTP